MDGALDVCTLMRGINSHYTAYLLTNLLTYLHSSRCDFDLFHLDFHFDLIQRIYHT